jgi:hypothetical protein
MIVLSDRLGVGPEFVADLFVSARQEVSRKSEALLVHKKATAFSEKGAKRDEGVADEDKRMPTS